VSAGRGEPEDDRPNADERPSALEFDGEAVEGEFVDDSPGVAPRPGDAHSATQMSFFQEHYYGGPLPPSMEFNSYGHVVKDAPERILRMAEDAHHRTLSIQERQTGIDERLAEAAIEGSKRTDVLAFWTFAFSMLVAVVLALTGSDWRAIAVVAGSGATIGVFVKTLMGKDRQSRDD
jgi:uncharacterized membrane protein